MKYQTSYTNHMNHRRDCDYTRITDKSRLPTLEMPSYTNTGVYVYTGRSVWVHIVHRNVLCVYHLT